SAPRASIRSTMASTNVVVLPVPGPARTSSGPLGWSTTERWAASNVGTKAGIAGGRTRRTWELMGTAHHSAPTTSGERPGRKGSEVRGTFVVDARRRLTAQLEDPRHHGVGDLATQPAQRRGA